MGLNIALHNKRVLFLSPSFFGYEEKIIAKLKEYGAIVDYFDERPIQGALNRAILKVFPSFFENKTKTYYHEILQQVTGRKYDFVLVIKGGMIPKSFLKDIRKLNPHAYFTLYLWDAVKNIRGVEDKFALYNQVYSFDAKDVSLYPGLLLRPLFFSDEYRSESHINKNEYLYDLGFMGTIHTDRYRILKEIERLAEQNQWRIFFFKYLQGDFIYYVYRILKKEFRKTKKEDFQYGKMSADEITQVVANTNAIIDIEHPNQTGLTMRTIEMIGMNKKLITTNTNILDYDFYNSDNIIVISRQDITIPEDFLSKPYRELPKKTYEKYSLDYWVLEVLGLEGLHEK